MLYVARLLRLRGLPVWCLSILWAAAGAAGAGYDFILSEHLPDPAYLWIPTWVGEPESIYLVAVVGVLSWLLLTIPVLVAGFVRIWRRWLQTGSSAGLSWVGAWIAGVLLIFPIANWQPSAPEVLACTKGQGCALAGYRYAIVSWGELAVLAAWLVLGAAMILILAVTGRRRPGAPEQGAPSRPNLAGQPQ